MSIWTKFDGEIILSGQKYDGKGFNLKSVWWNCNPTRGGTKRHFFTVLNDGKISTHYSTEQYCKALKEVNVPRGSEGGSIVDILESKLDNKIHITFSRNLRKYIPSEELRNWIIDFIKKRQAEGWKVKCDIAYGMDSNSKDKFYMSFSHQDFAIEERFIYKDNKEFRQTWMHYLNDPKKTNMIFEQEENEDVSQIS